MRIAIITWVKYHNYGTQLQAYALQEFLITSGFDVKIFSDDIIIKDIFNRTFYVDEHKKNNSIDNVSNMYSRKYLDYINPVVIAKKVKNRINKYYNRRTKKKRSEFEKAKADIFNSFIGENLIIEEIDSRERLHELSNSYDAFVCGSDQIWSLRESFDEYYYLAFTDKKKVSYAPSIGADKLDEAKIDTLRNLLTDFSYISVREKKTKEQLEDILSREVQWTLDPTMLFDCSFWKEKTKDIVLNKKKFLLCYFLENKSWYFDYSKELARYLGLKIVLVPNKAEYISESSFYKQDVDPFKFLKLIESAEFVLTDSYHGLLFCLNFNKQFLYLKRFSDFDSKSQNIRVYSIIDYLNLNELVVEDNIFKKEDIVTIDYNGVNAKIDEFRNKSKDFLLKSLLE